MIGGKLPPFFLVSCVRFAGGFFSEAAAGPFPLPLAPLHWDCASPGMIERKKWCPPGKQRTEYLPSRVASINLYRDTR
jgi:hypothetical protein